MELIEYFSKFCENKKELTYKNICKLTNETYYSGGNVKLKQIEYWDTLAVIEKVGAKYKFIEMKVTEDDVEYNKIKLNTAYEILLENMICLALDNSGGKLCEVTIRDLMSRTGMVNNNYVNCRYDSKYIMQLVNTNMLTPLDNEDFNELDMDVFFNKTETNYKRRVREALKNLQKQRVIDITEVVYKTVKVGKISRNVNLSEYERSIKLDIENETLKKLGKKSVDELQGKEISNYYFIWIKKLQSKLNCEHIGFKYNIIIGENALKNKISNAKSEIYQCINKKVIDNLIGNGNYITFVDWFINNKTKDDDIDYKVRKLKSLKINYD